MVCIPWAGIFNTVPVPANTVPVMGTGTYRTHIRIVSHETHGILIIKNIITITL